MSLSLDKNNIQITLLEGIDPSAETCFHQAGYTQVKRINHALGNQELIDQCQDTHIIGIRSRTQLTAEVITKLPKLMAIGCFCIGSNQVHLDMATARAIPVFNAPFANTRSVAELVLGQMILLLRRIPEKSALAHQGIWQKSATAAFETRGKTLGIVGYGHIGSQLSVLAENLGMRVIYHDIMTKLPLGNAQAVNRLDELLSTADVVSLHVPSTTQTHQMIQAEELEKMKPGSILINASRGQVVDLNALTKQLKTQHLAGAAIDVFPLEPSSNEYPFESPLRGLNNVILTPHIGGSTIEAQQRIGIEVSEKLIRYSDNGSTRSALNFPQVNLPEQQSKARLLHVHKNRPGIMNQINQIFSDAGVNINGQYLQTAHDIGYVIMEADDLSGALITQIKTIEGTLRVRQLLGT